MKADVECVKLIPPIIKFRDPHFSFSGALLHDRDY